MIGQPHDGQCPECATPVERSLTTNDLRHADRGWLRGLSRGCLFLLTSVVLFVIAMLVPFGLIFMNLASATAGLAMDYLMMGTMAAGFITFILGLFLITTQEPRDTLTEGDVSIRRIVRVCSLAMPILFMLDDVIDPPWAILLLAAFFLTMIVGLTGALRRLSGLARRLPDKHLDTLAHRSMVRVAVLGTVAAAGMIAGKFATFPSWLNGLIWMVFLVASFRGLALFGRLRNRVVEILGHATP